MNRPERALGGWDSGSGGIAINHYQVGKPPFVFGSRSIDPAKAECVGYRVILWPHTILSSPAGLALKEPHRISSDLRVFSPPYAKSNG